MGLPMTSDQSVGVRAGFWRRALASLIDLIITLVPFQLIAAILFVTTSGQIQMSKPVGFEGICSALETVPDNLVPPPPAGSNFARECNVYFLGAQTVRYLQVGRLTIEGTSGRSVALEYMLDRDGHQTNGVSVDWIAVLALIAYLVAMETRTGATLGSRTMRIRVIDAAKPAVLSVPLRKIALRYLAMLIGFLPYFFAGLRLYGSDIEDIAASSVFMWLLVIGGGVALGWIIFLSVQIACKRDPLYDWMAGTAVVRPLGDHHHRDLWIAVVLLVAVASLWFVASQSGPR
jgi:hypothetical protein